MYILHMFARCGIAGAHFMSDVKRFKRSSQFDMQFRNVNWPRNEFIVNVLCAILFLLGGVLETLNVWRWDYSHGSPMSYNGGIKNIGYYGRRYMGVTSYGQYGGYGGYGGGMMKLRGMSLMQKINYQAHCMRYPRYCRDYHSMLAGYSTYLGKTSPHRNSHLIVF